MPVSDPGDPSEHTVPPYHPIPHYLQRAGAVLVIVYIVAALYFFDGSSLQHWFTLGTTFLTMAIIVCGTQCTKFALDECCQKFEQRDMKTNTAVMRHTLAWITYSQAMLLVAVYTFGWSPCILTYLIIILNFLPGQLACKAYSRFSRKISVDYRRNYKIVVFGILFHITVLTIGILYSLKFKSLEDQIAVFVCHGVYAVFYSATTIDYVIMKVDGAYLCYESLRVQQQKVLSICEKLAKEDPERLGHQLRNCNLACEVCFMEFNEIITAQIPRMLPKCGHTFCHQCSEKLARDNCNQHIYCPTCRLSSEVPDKLVSCLPKNYAIISILREINAQLESKHLVDEMAEGGGSKENDKKEIKKCNQVTPIVTV
ncbi:unnamed protein product [Caenorhabditis brenneri]